MYKFHKTMKVVGKANMELLFTKSLYEGALESTQGNSGR